MELGRAMELIGRYAADQWGMVTSRQAYLAGIDGVGLHRLRNAGLLRTVRRGVHALSSSPHDDVDAERAVWLSLRPEVAGWERPMLDPDGAVLSHQSALRLHHLGDLARTHIELTAPRRRSSRDPRIRFHVARLADTDVTEIGGLPVTTVSRTVRDLLEQHVDESHIATVLRQAIDAGQVRTDELVHRLAPFARRYGVEPGNGLALLERLLEHSVSPLVQAALRHSGVTWGELAERQVTWGDLAALTADPALTRLLFDRNDP